MGSGERSWVWVYGVVIVIGVWVVASDPGRGRVSSEQRVASSGPGGRDNHVAHLILVPSNEVQRNVEGKAAVNHYVVHPPRGCLR